MLLLLLAAMAWEVTERGRSPNGCLLTSYEHYVAREVTGACALCGSLCVCQDAIWDRDRQVAKL